MQPIVDDIGLYTQSHNRVIIKTGHTLSENEIRVTYLACSKGSLATHSVVSEGRLENLDIATNHSNDIESQCFSSVLVFA